MLSENSLLNAPGDSWLLDKLSVPRAEEGQQGQDVGVRMGLGGWLKGISSDLHLIIEVGFAGCPGVKTGSLENV